MSRLDYILQDPFSTQADVDEFEGEDEDLSDDEDPDESDDGYPCGACR